MVIDPSLYSSPIATSHGPYGASTTYRTGGTARLLLRIDSLEDLTTLAPALAASNPVTVLGNGSNTLVADREFDGVVVVLGPSFETLTIVAQNETTSLVTLGGAIDLPVAARRIVEAGLSGFEWAVGVPGTAGGATVMNAGGHGSDMAASVVSASIWRIDERRVQDVPANELEFGYRRSALSSRDIVLSVTLQLEAGSSEASKEMLKEIVRWRRENQPGGANAGSVFQNPENAKAGALIEQCGLKGLRRGSAYVSEKHANFIQSDEGGSASDVRELIRYVHDEVLRQTGVDLRTEIRFVGFHE